MRLKQKFGLGIFLFFSIVANAQLITTNNLTVSQYVQDVLLGANVAVSNITFNGGAANVTSNAVGGFDCPDCNLGIPSGFAMCTGSVANMVGPNNTSSNGTGNGISGTPATYDPDLYELIQANGFSAMNDWAIIEFDFVPLGDTIQFVYVFGSEEYPEYTGAGTCGNISDVFGMFISGPGINGTYANNAINMAQIPGTTEFVSIQNLNGGCDGTAEPGDANCNYCEFYVNNGDGFTEPSMSDDYYIQYDGFTTPLTAMALVQCGQTYHMKLAICDTQDGIYDTGIFLQRESFTSNLVVQTTLNLSVGGPDQNTIFEDCGDGYLDFQRPPTGNSNTQLVAYLTYAGTAQNGVDYTDYSGNALPDSIVFLPGVMSVSLEIDAIMDGLNEGNETAIISIENIADCGETFVQADFEFFVADVPEPLVVTGVDYTICQGVVQNIEPIIEGGYAVYNYTWSTGANTPTIDVSPATDATYTVIVGDTCGMPSDDAQFNVTVLATPAMTVDLVDPFGAFPIGCNAWATLQANVSGGIAPYSYSFYDENGTLWSFDNQVQVSSANVGLVYVEVEDECGFVEEASFDVVTNIPELVVDLPDAFEVVCQTPYNVVATVSGGQTPYNYNWFLNGVNDWTQFSQNFTGTTSEPFELSLTVWDGCGQSVTDVLNDVTVSSPPIDLSLPNTVSGTCVTMQNIAPIMNGGSGAQNQWNFEWTDGAGNVIGNSAILNHVFQVDDEAHLSIVDVCGADTSGFVIVDIENPPISVSLGEDLNSSCVTTNNLNASIGGGSGGEIFSWMINGELASNAVVFPFQTFATEEVVVMVTDACGSSAGDTMVINIPNEPLVISVPADTAICPGQSALLQVSISGGEQPYTAVWNDEIVGESVTIQPNQTLSYSVAVNDICGRIAENQFEVVVDAVDAGLQVEPIEENTYAFTAMAEIPCDSCVAFWDFGDGSVASGFDVEHQFDGTDDYTVTLTLINSIGCSNEVTYPITAPAYIYIPSAFTPNGDGLNDVYQLYSHGVAQFEFVIFNRWGDEVFRTSDPVEVWLGGYDNGDYYLANGVYSYYMKLKGFDGQLTEKKGNITVMR